jgi:hypothetical protein
MSLKREEPSADQFKLPADFEMKATRRERR